MRGKLRSRVVVPIMLGCVALVSACVAPPVPVTGPVITGQACPEGDDGVTVVVDYTSLNNSIKVACASGPQASGLAALAAAGFTQTEVPTYPGAVCTINSLPAQGFPFCWETGGYWGYYRSDRVAAWDYSPVGAADGPLVEGSVEGWAWQPDFVGDVPGVSIAGLAAYTP
ncbi:MAG: hypothetical protein WD029_05170 [Microthrixaceae bacterium]